MLAWSRPDPLTRDLIHLINARRHDHGDTDAAIDTLQAFLEQGREHDLLTVLAALDEVYINGTMESRLPNNLNISFAFVEGESLLMGINDVAVSSGSACTSATLEPSYVLKALGRNDELAHSSIRFTLGRFTTEEEVDYAIKLLHDKIGKLREMSPLWEMYKDGIDLNTVQWAAH